LSANVFAFPNRGKGPQPWTNDELAELYRVVDLLGRAGLSVATDIGMSDEGDPWFVFCRADNEEVIAHFARIDGIFVAASIAVDETYRGANFRQIVDRMVSSQPLVVPSPGPGSRLLLHPVVLLTAFVATALAHSEKMMAQDWLRSVEAQWEHGKEGAVHALKQVKTSWADTLHNLMKLPVHEAKVAYDSAKEGMTLTLASLIAIAMTALQPIAEKIAILAQLVDEMPGHAAEISHQAAGHVSALLFDAPLVAASDDGTNEIAGRHGMASRHVGGAAGSGVESPMAHKAAPSAALDASSSDGANAVIDAAHFAAPVVQKSAVDEPSHMAIDSQFEANLAVAVQKVIVPALQQLDAVVVHFDTGAVSVPTLDLQNVTADALHLLDIHLDNKSDGDTSGVGKSGSAQLRVGSDTIPPPETPKSSSSLSETPVPSAGSNAVVVSSSGSGASGTTVGQVVTPPPAPVSPSGDVVIDVSKVSGQTVIDAVSDFVTSGSHGISQQVAISDPIAQQQLAGILSVYGTVKVVFFDSTSPTSDVFLYSPGVVFVEEKDLTSPHLSNGGGDLILEGGAAGTITLTGVAIVSHVGSV